MPRPLVLTTDCGAEVDDQWAIAHQALAPELDLRVLVTTHTGSHKLPGDSASEYTASCAREVLDNLPLAGPAPEVVAGSPVPLGSADAPEAGAGVDRIIQEAAAFDSGNRLAVLAIGAVTDIASALLLDPTLTKRIEVIAMGFNEWPAGGDPFNVKNDVAAWQALLRSDVPITIGGSDACKRHLIVSLTEARKRFTRGAGPYIEGMLSDWVLAHEKFCKFVTGDAESWPIWDEVTTAHLLNMTEVAAYPRPGLSADTSFVQEEGGDRPPIRWITWVDEERLWSHFEALLAGE